MALYLTSPRLRGVMWRASVATTLLGFTEPLFVPTYWNPPSLFELARRTGFDIESLIFAFGIGGIGVALYHGLAHHHLISGPVEALTVPGRNGGGPVAAVTGVVPRDAAVVAKLLMLSFIVSAGVGVFEVGLVLRGKQELQLTPSQIAVMFSACSLVMFGLQAIVLSPRVKPGFTRWLIGPALAVLAGGLLLVLRVLSFLLMLGVIGAVSASAGILSPVLTYLDLGQGREGPRLGTGQANGGRQPRRHHRLGGQAVCCSIWRAGEAPALSSPRGLR